MRVSLETLAAFVDAACVPLVGPHEPGTIDEAEALLAATPGLAQATIYTAAIRGDARTVRRFLEANPNAASSRTGPRRWDPLTYLCFSRFLRLDTAKADAFVRTARMLLDAGARANTGFFVEEHGHREFESVLYGAAGVAHHTKLTRVLVGRGANPNNDEVAYHTPETFDNGPLSALLASGRLTKDSLAMMLARKHDWHDYDGIKLLLDHGADPNRLTRWGRTALHQAIARGNHRAHIELLLNHGADPTRVAHGCSAVALAARWGRRDLLQAFEQRGVSVALGGVDGLLAACARADHDRIAAITASRPRDVRALVANGGKWLAAFANSGNGDGVRELLDLDIDPGAVDDDGDGYWGLNKRGTALHAAAWRARHPVVALLVARGAPVNATDERGQSPLMLAVRACVDSYWSDNRSPASVATLLDAGASTDGVLFPCGYEEVDNLLRRHGARSR